MDTASKRLRPAQQKRSEISKNKVLESARALFAEKGYSKTRVSDIIKHSGVSTGSFYHRFTDKMGVFLVLLEEYTASSKAIIENYDFSRDEYRSLREVFEEMTRNSCDRLEQSRGFLLAANEISIEQQYVWDQMRDLTRVFCMKAASFIHIYEEEISAELDVEFHLIIAKATHNTMMVHLIESIRDTIKNSILKGLQKRFTAEQKEIVQGFHETIVERMIQRDALGAAQAMSDHFDELSMSLQADA